MTAVAPSRYEMPRTGERRKPQHVAASRAASICPWQMFRSSDKAITREFG